MSEYEFTQEENRIFLNFMLGLLILSFSLVVTGVVLLIEGLKTGFIFSDFALSIGLFLLAASFITPLVYFKNIITTSGDDINELITGISKMNLILFIAIGVFVIISLTVIIMFIVSYFSQFI